MQQFMAVWIVVFGVLGTATLIQFIEHGDQVAAWISERISPYRISWLQLVFWSITFLWVLWIGAIPIVWYLTK